MVASFVKGKHKAANVEVWVVPGSKQVEKQAIEEGIDKIFEEAGFMLRQPGCSACLGMNEDKIPAGKYCISTSNRNFEEGRAERKNLPGQSADGRTGGYYGRGRGCARNIIVSSEL